MFKDTYLTNAAILLFHKNPEKYVFGSFIKIGFFESNSEIIYQDEIHGPIVEQVDKAIELLYFKYLKAKISYKGIQRIERYPFPQEAIREALLNAIVHKDYTSGVPIQISVYDDKIYIGNTGKLPESWTLDKLMDKHASIPHNPSIAHVFYLAGFIESWGRGIEKICNACEADEIDPPKYTINPGDIMVALSAPADRVVYSGERVEKTGVSNHTNPPENPPENPPVRDEKKTVEESILEYCQEYRSTKEIMEHLDYKDARYFRKAYLRPLINAGKLLPLYPESPSSRNQKYITKK